MPLNVLIAPDKFKGSLDAEGVCAAIRKGLIRADHTLHIIEQPMADGGEGTCELLTNFSHGKFVQVQVSDPLSRQINTFFGISQDGKTAFIEMAKASGLQLLKATERNPWNTSTVGTGEMIEIALNMGVSDIIMGIGGSATNDGGMGMAIALGINFFDGDGNKLRGTGSDLHRVAKIDLSSKHARLDSVRFTIFCDVDNPLSGRDGAAYIFSPQKGADPKMVEALDFGLRQFGERLRLATSRDVDFPGAGAGGGLPASLKAFANIRTRPGMEFISEFIGLDGKVANADVVFTGEGKVDRQTLSGKVVKGVADLARKHRKPLVVIAGKSELSKSDFDRLPAHRGITLVDDHTTERHAIENAAAIIEERVFLQWEEILIWNQK